MLRTFCEPIDRILRGGLPVGVVTEVCGAPGAGKTQLAMQLSAIVQLPVSRGGLGGNAVYLDSEGSFTPERLSEIAGALSALGSLSCGPRALASPLSQDELSAMACDPTASATASASSTSVPTRGA